MAALALLGTQLGKAVGPRRVDAMCGACIDEHGPIVVGRDERGGLFGRIIRKAQYHGISLVDGLRACFRILALVFWQRQQLDVLARLEPRANLQARGAGLTLRDTARDGREVVRCMSARWRSCTVSAEAGQQRAHR